MRSYEMVFIVHPDLEGDESDGVINDIEDLISRNNGKMTKVEPWGLRKLAYPIKKQQEGRYFLMEFDLEPQNITEMERVLRLMESVIRHLIVRLEP
ncbi:MAG: 30S ribosomal protein S6 [Anaerolineae bacterium]